MSLRSSQVRGFDLKLRRTDQALHDTTKRFVESLSHDIRISQHADLVFASKRFASEQWYWLESSGRTGFLVFQTKCPVVWIDDQFKQSFRIPMRVSFHVYERGSIFLASLDKVNGLLRVEDCWKLSGELLRQHPFTHRWEKLHEFFDRMYKPDPVLQQGMMIEPAKYEPLINALSWTTKPNLMFAQGENAPRRLRVYFQPREEQHQTPAEPKRTEMIKKIITNDPTNDSIAKAVPHEEFPDTYDLWIQGVKKGYAAVQDIQLSKSLRLATASKEQKEILVKIQWNEEFDMHEIIGIHQLE